MSQNNQNPNSQGYPTNYPQGQPLLGQPGPYYVPGYPSPPGQPMQQGSYPNVPYPQQPGYQAQQMQFGQSGLPGQPMSSCQPGYPGQPMSSCQPGYPGQPMSSCQPGYPGQQMPSCQPGYPAQAMTSVPPGYPAIPTTSISSGYQTQNTPYYKHECPPPQGFPQQQYPQQHNVQGYNPGQPGFGGVVPGYPTYPQKGLPPGPTNVNIVGKGDKNNKYCHVGPPIPSLRPVLTGLPSADAIALNKAFKGIGCDRKMVCYLVCHRTSDQLEQIKSEYLKQFRKSLVERVSSELSSSLKRCIVAALHNGPEKKAYFLRKATKGIGTDEDALRDVLCTCPSWEIARICESYQRLYGKSLIDDISSDTSGSFKQILISLITKPRDPSTNVDPALASIDISNIYKGNTIMKGGANENLIPIFCERNYNQLRYMIQQFQGMHGQSLYSYVKGFFSSHYEKTLMAIISFVVSERHFYCKTMRQAILNGNINRLIQIVLCRCEIDLTSILQDYQLIYKKAPDSEINQVFSVSHHETVEALFMLMGFK